MQSGSNCTKSTRRFLLLHVHSPKPGYRTCECLFLVFITDSMRKNESLQLNEKCRVECTFCVQFFFTRLLFTRITHLARRPFTFLLLHTSMALPACKRTINCMISLSAIYSNMVDSAKQNPQNHHCVVPLDFCETVPSSDNFSAQLTLCSSDSNKYHVIHVCALNDESHFCDLRNDRWYDD